MTHLICLAGPEGSGRDKLLADLAEALEARGLRVGLLGPAADGPGLALELASAGLRLVLRAAPDMTIEELAARYLDEADIVISLVHQGVKRAKLEFVPAGAEPSLADDPGLKAVVGPGPAPDGAALLPADDPDAVAEYVIAEMMPKGDPSAVRVFLGGRRLPMKDFVQDMVGDTARAMIGALRGGDRGGRLMIIVEEK